MAIPIAKEETMNAFKSLILSLALSSLFTSLVVRADDCGDALIAESCACHSAGQPRSSAKPSPSDRQSRTRKSTKPHLARRDDRSITLPEKTMPEK